MRFNLIHPSRRRPIKSAETFKKWSDAAEYPQGAIWILSVDYDDDIPAYVDAYQSLTHTLVSPVINKNKSSVEAINNGAKHFMAEGDVFIVVSDDTEPCHHWDTKIYEVVKDKTDWILKTQDGIQSYIITMPVMDRAYFNRTGTIYHPDFVHLFSDTYLTCLADINGRSITSNLVFPHRHYSHSGGKEGPDQLHKRNDATWQQGEALFIKLMKEFTPQQRSLIKDQGMKNWLRNKGVV